MEKETCKTGGKNSFENELAELRKNWQLRPLKKNITFHKQLARNEFLSFTDHQQQQTKALSQILSQAANHIPYYQNLFKQKNISHLDIKSPAELTSLPVLNKIDVHRNFEELTAKALPSGQKITAQTLSSGTTGQPTRVLQSNYSSFMFSCLKQRELRWFRLNPKSYFTSIRLPSQLPAKSDGKYVDIGETLKLSAWPYIGKFFITGPFLGYSVFNPIDSQVEWLNSNKPDYLLSYSESLEHLAFTYKNKKKNDSLKSLIAISQQLTPSMRQHIEKTFGISIHQNYGLNEIGIVASRCTEGGRYHVHTEHCFVEIVDEAGNPSKPGETGKILVTTFSNFAMPLIRYDTDDLAVALDGPCPCGRTLPSFGEVVGRYSRIAYLPDNTLGYVGAIRQALEEMPAELSVNLRQFQVHQFLDNRFELRLFAPGSLPQEFSNCIHTAWQEAIGEEKLPLTILEVDEIQRSPGGKFQDFTSEFFPKPDRE
jgi:phenylacetate-CoA ligase